MTADNGGFADDDTCSVVDGEMVADDRPGMDVDASVGMGELREHPRDDRHAEQVQFMNRRSNADGEGRSYDDGGSAPEPRRYGSAPAGGPGMPPMPEANGGAADAPVDDIPF